MSKLISKEQWAEILEGFIKLRVVIRTFKYKGHILKVQPIIHKERHIHWQVLINNDAKKEWIEGNTDAMPISEDVWHKRTTSKYKATAKKSFIKRVGIRRAKKLHPDLDEIFVVYSPGFTSPRTLLNQFKKLEGLELIDNEEVPTNEQ